MRINHLKKLYKIKSKVRENPSQDSNRDVSQNDIFFKSDLQERYMLLYIEKAMT